VVDIKMNDVSQTVNKDLNSNGNLEITIDKSNSSGGGRDFSIDILRIISILLIFLAHTSLKDDPHGILFNIRAFDVVAMVFASGLSFSKTYKGVHSVHDYLIYVKKRFIRLVIPAWIFVTTYVLFSFFMNFIIPNNNFELKKVLLSYSLISGIGYVWIVRIFFCIAIVAPFIKLFCERVKNYYFVFFVFLGLSSLLTIATHYSSSLAGIASTIINILVIPFLSYSVVYLLAICYSKMNVYQKVVCFSILLALTVCFSILSGFNVDFYKYPPSYLYLSYGCCCSIFLYEVISYIVKLVRLETNCIVAKSITWLSKNSFLLYFVHLFFVFFIDNNVLIDNYGIQFLIILFGTLLISIPISLCKMLINNYIKKKTYD